VDNLWEGFSPTDDERIWFTLHPYTIHLGNAPLLRNFARKTANISCATYTRWVSPLLFEGVRELDSFRHPQPEVRYHHMVDRSSLGNYQ
jgi:hypothetical protein